MDILDLDLANQIFEVRDIVTTPEGWTGVVSQQRDGIIEVSIQQPRDEAGDFVLPLLPSSRLYRAEELRYVRAGKVDTWGVVS